MQGCARKVVGERLNLLTSGGEASLLWEGGGRRERGGD